MKLQENGFSLYEWSDFYEIESYRYANVIVIDDKYDFLDGLQKEFHDVENLRALQVSDKEVALEYLLKGSPDAALLDMHLTTDESFEGLWIANQLIAN